MTCARTVEEIGLAGPVCSDCDVTPINDMTIRNGKKCHSTDAVDLVAERFGDRLVFVALKPLNDYLS